MTGTYPLSGEVVHSGATYRDHMEHRGEMYSVRVLIVRPAQKDDYWLTRVIDCQEPVLRGLTVPRHTAYLYQARTGYSIRYAGTEAAPYLPDGLAHLRKMLSDLRPEDDTPYGGLQIP